MKNTHSLGRLHSFVLRGFVVALFGLFSTVAFAQTELNNLVDAPTAVNRLSPHFDAVLVAFESLSPSASNYEFEKARLDMTLRVFEDAQLNISPEVSITKSFIEGMGDPASGGRALIQESIPTGGVSTLPINDSIVAELANLLKQ